MSPARFTGLLHRYRHPLFAAWLLHAFALHYLMLGLVTWDGFGYRGFPIVELAQHGTFHAQHFYDWSLTGYTPFLELVHLPFVRAFGLTGFLIGFPLVLFPLCVAAVFKLVRQLTGDHRAATFGAFAYVAMPMINAQPFAAYVDFAVVGLLAYFVYAMLRMVSDEPRWRSCIRLVVATILFTMARAQGVYIAVVLVPIVAFALCCRREHFRLRVSHPRALVWLLLCVATGSIPEIAIQIEKYLTYGSPIAPMELDVLGIKLGTGVSRAVYFTYAGLGGDDLASLVRGFVDGWAWHWGWPIGGFFSSRFWGGGLVFHLAVALSVAAWRRTTRVERALLVAFALISLLTRDFAIPRYSYTIVTAITVVIGRGMAALSESSKRTWPFWIGVCVLGAHLARPELDAIQYSGSGWVAPHMNVAGSRYFLDHDEYRVFPDRSYKLVIVENTSQNFVLHLYGRKISNEILGTVFAKDLGTSCSGLRTYAPDVLFVDDHDLTRNCHRTCALPPSRGCRAWHIDPGP